MTSDHKGRGILSIKLDLKETNPEHFSESTLVDFSWYFPFGKDEEKWKKKMFDQLLAEEIAKQKKKIKEKDKIVKTSKKFKTV